MCAVCCESGYVPSKGPVNLPDGGKEQGLFLAFSFPLFYLYALPLSFCAMQGPAPRAGLASFHPRSGSGRQEKIGKGL